MKKPAKTKPAALRGQKLVGRRTLRKLKPVYRRKIRQMQVFEKRELLFVRLQAKLIDPIEAYVKMLPKDVTGRLQTEVKDMPGFEAARDKVKILARKEIIKHFGLSKYLGLHSKLKSGTRIKLSRRETKTLIKQMRKKAKELAAIGAFFNKKAGGGLMEQPLDITQRVIQGEFLHLTLSPAGIFRNNLAVAANKLKKLLKNKK